LSILGAWQIFNHEGLVSHRRMIAPATVPSVKALLILSSIHSSAPLSCLALGLLISVLATSIVGENMPLKIGDPVPEFDLPAVEGEKQFRLKLSDFRGKKHVLVSFHPIDWTPT
jgi:hypothetical protein